MRRGQHLATLGARMRDAWAAGLPSRTVGEGMR